MKSFNEYITEQAKPIEWKKIGRHWHSTNKKYIITNCILWPPGDEMFCIYVSDGNRREPEDMLDRISHDGQPDESAPTLEAAKSIVMEMERKSAEKQAKHDMLMKMRKANAFPSETPQVTAKRMVAALSTMKEFKIARGKDLHIVKGGMGKVKITDWESWRKGSPTIVEVSAQLWSVFCLEPLERPGGFTYPNRFNGLFATIEQVPLGWKHPNSPSEFGIPLRGARKRPTEGLLRDYNTAKQSGSWNGIERLP